MNNTRKTLWIILSGILGVFIMARFISYLMIETQILPKWLSLTVSGFRLHHFVYGNILLVITSFFAIALDTKKYRNWLAGFYGIGLGLVLDEFPLWMGYIPQLTANVVFIPVAPIVVLAATGVILTLIFLSKKR